MKIIIIGAGEVGFSLAQHLSSDGHEIVVIERNPEIVQQLNESLDVLVVSGNGASARGLESAGVRDTDMAIAATTVDEINLVASMFAHKFGVPVIIARVRNTEYTQDKAGLSASDLGIDLMIHPEDAASEEIVRILKRAAATEVVDVADGKVQLVGCRVEEHALLAGRKLADVAKLWPQLTFRMVAVMREDTTTMPTGEFECQPRDQVFFVAAAEDVPSIIALAGRHDQTLKRVMILGYIRIGRTVARKLAAAGVQTKLIEKDEERALIAAERLPYTLILHGNATDLDLLQAESVHEMDAVVATTSDQEDNIMACLIAKQAGAPKTITLLTRSHYHAFMSLVGIDAAISPQQSVVNTVRKFVRGGKIMSLAHLSGIDAEVIEVEVTADSRVAGKSVRDAGMPKDSILTAIIRDGELVVATGDAVICEGDQVVIFALPDAIMKVDSLFS